MLKNRIAIAALITFVALCPVLYGMGAFALSEVFDCRDVHDGIICSWLSSKNYLGGYNPHFFALYLGIITVPLGAVSLLVFGLFCWKKAKNE